jgi:hypothetical protein
MSLIRVPATRRRVDPVPAHVYTLPVVRELPSQRELVTASLLRCPNGS